MDRSYQFTMTAQTASALIEPLERALWEQHQRLSLAIAPSRRLLRWAGLGLCVVALASVLPYLWVEFHPQLAGYAVAVVLLFALFMFMPEIEPTLRARARRSTAHAARRSLEPVIARAPYEISYLLGETRIETSAPQLGIHYVLELRGLQRAIVADHLVAVFKRRNWPVATRILYAPSDEELNALRVRLHAAGVEVLYAAPPEAVQAAA